MKEMNIKLIIMAVVFSSNSCDKEILLDEKLTLEKESYTGNQLRIDGYYYTQFRDIHRIYFLYRDGTLFSGGDVYENKLNEYEQKYQNGSFWDAKKNNKLYWGLYNVDSDDIMIEKWHPSSGGGMLVYLHSGEILNDTTFVITKSVRPKTGEEKDLNEVYHFREFSPKPDSTNNFL